MANELTVQRDSIDDAADNLSPVRGIHLKFDNAWFSGFDREKANTNQDYIITDMDEAWQYLMKGQPVQYFVRERGSKVRPPRPDILAEKKDWPIYNGEPSDPVRYASIIHLMATKTGETFNFVSPTAGAWACRTELLDQIVSMRRLQPGAVPIVRLGSTSFPTQYGVRQRPMLRIVGWQRPKPQAEDPALIEAMPVVKHKSKAKTPVAEMVTAEVETINPFNDALPPGM
jgi:hypothetical protein